MLFFVLELIMTVVLFVFTRRRLYEKTFKRHYGGVPR